MSRRLSGPRRAAAAEQAADSIAEYTADLVVVEWPADWTPTSWRDTPPKIRSLWTERSRIPLEDALSLQFGFNAAAMADASGTVWTCVLAAWEDSHV